MASWCDSTVRGATTPPAGTELQPTKADFVRADGSRVPRVPPSSIHHLLWNAA